MVKVYHISMQTVYNIAHILPVSIHLFILP